MNNLPWPYCATLFFCAGLLVGITYWLAAEWRADRKLTHERKTKL